MPQPHTLTAIFNQFHQFLNFSSPKLQIDSKTSIFQQIRSKYLWTLWGSAGVPGWLWGRSLNPPKRQGTDFSGASKDPVDFTLKNSRNFLVKQRREKLGERYIVVDSLGGRFEGIILTHHIITSYFTIINPFHVFISRIIHHLHFMYPSHSHSSYHSSTPFFFTTFFSSK